MPSDELLRVTTSDGKYTVIQNSDGHVEILRYGNTWAPRVGMYAKAIVQLAYDLEDARNSAENDND
jgi:hypothetical protein